MGKTVDSQLAMTGEITLRGNILPVGGVKEKVLAAHRAGVRTIVLPKRCAPDLAEIPKDVFAQLTFHFVETVDELFKIVFGAPTVAEAQDKNTEGDQLKNGDYQGPYPSVMN
jgi:ATP-dependent Lon protease